MTRRGAIAGLAACALAAPACRSSAAKRDCQVLVIGAGLSGLYSAMLLEAEGYDVQVVEASDRIGGRMFTLNHADGYTEGGGQQIGASYARVLDVAERLSVPLYAETAHGPSTAYYINGAWSDTVDVAQFPKAYRETPPASVLFRLLRDAPGLSSASDWLDAAPELDISAARFLANRGFDTSARALIERAFNGTNLERYSMLNLHRTWQLYRQSADIGATRYVKGGSQRLPEAMAASLNRPVRLKTKVRDLISESDHVAVQLERSTLRAEHVVCTVPFAVLNMMHGFMDVAHNSDAIRALPYTKIKQFHMRTERPFWEDDGLGPSMWTDTPVERVFADSGHDGSLKGFHRGWVNGDGTENWAQQHDAAGKTYLDALTALRPSTKGALSMLSVVDWTRTNTLAGGAYYHWAPGQAGRFARTMGEPVGRIRFAGEHLGILHTGMEAAMESAERAAINILEGTT